MKKIFSLLTTLLFVGTTWATDPVASQAPTDGESYVVAAYVNSKYYALPNGSVSGSQIPGTEISLNAIGKVSTSDADGITWTLEEGETSGQFYFKYKNGDNTYYLYKNGTGNTNYNLKVSTGSKNYWTFATNGTGYTVTAVDRGTNNTKLACQSGTFSVRSTATAIILLPIGNVPSNPIVTISPKSLDFGTVEKDAVVAAKTFALTGSNLTDANKVTVTAPDGYKVSIGDADPATSLQLTPSSKKIASTTIKVTPVTSVGGTYNSNITISSDDLDADSTVALKMTVVTPVPVTGVTLNKSTLTLADGDSETLTATIVPNDATNKNVTWESDDDDIATVDENGLVTGVKAGTTTITCKSVADNTKNATCEVTVNGPDVVLDLTNNTNWGIPEGSTKTTGTNSYTAGDYTITLYGPSGNGYYYDASAKNLMIGKYGAYVALPKFADKAIAKVVTEGVSGGAAAVTFNIFEGEGSAVSTQVTSCKVDQTFNISPKKKNTEYRIKITNDNNARFGEIKIYFGEPDPVVTFATPENGTLVVKKGETAIKSGDAFVAGTVLTVEAEPASADYKLKTIYAGGNNITESKQFTVGTEDIEVSATFEEKEEATFSWESTDPVVRVLGDPDLLNYETWQKLNNNGFYSVTVTSSNTDVIPSMQSYGASNTTTYWFPTAVSATGTTTITASFAGTDDIKAKNVSYTVTIKTTSGLAWSDESKNVQYGASNTYPTLTKPEDLTATITYSSTDEDIATIDAEGAITLKANGSTTIKAKFVNDPKYVDAEVSYTLNVSAGVVTTTPSPVALDLGEVLYGDDAENYGKSFHLHIENLSANKQVAVITHYSQCYASPKFYDADAEGVLDADVTILPINNLAPRENPYVDNIEVRCTGTREFADIVVGTVSFVSVQAYAITATAENGTLTFNGAAAPAVAKAGTEFTLVATPASGYTGGTITVLKAEDDSDVTSDVLDGSTLTMPAYAIKVAAAFARPYVAIMGEFNSWSGAANPLAVALDEKTASAAITLTLNENYGYGFKVLCGDNTLSIENGSEWYHLKRTWNSAPVKYISATSNPIWIEMDMSGDYTFTWDYTDSTLTITYPALPEWEYYVGGSFTEWGTNKVKMTTTDEETWTATFALEANKTGENKYEFKIVEKQLGETWLGLQSAASMVYGNCTDWVIGGGEAAIGLETTKKANYTFTYVPATKKVSVDIPNPSPATGVDNTADETKAVKFLQNGQIFILRGDKVYTVTGELVK